MDIFKGNKKAQNRFILLKVLFVISGILQGLSISFTIFLLKGLFLANYSQVLFWSITIGVLALLCFIIHFIASNIGNHMAVLEVCDNQIHRIGNSIIKLPLGWFDSSSKGRVSKAISTDINTISHYPSIVLPFIITTISTSTVIAIFLAIISWKIGIVIVIMAILLRHFWKLNMEALSKIEKEKTIANQNMESTIIEFAQLQSILRATGSLIGGWKRLDKALCHDRDTTLKIFKIQKPNTFKYMLTTNIGLLIMIIIAALELNYNNMELYTFFGITVAMIRFATPLAGLLPYGTEVKKILKSVERVNSIVKSKRLPEAEDNINLDKNTKDYTIEFKDVNFSYIDNVQVLNNINLNIPASKITALVGPSGSGKSTINKLIARFWDVDNGSVLINNVNVKDFKTEDLMSLISMVFQDVYLFDTTIKENIAMAKKDASDKEIEEAARKSRLDEVIKRLPNGWNTKVGEGGASLSGGEKQRVSIARAFLKDAPILLLDEITSSLDGTNEAIITESLKELSKNRTVVVIAHRLSSIKDADSIIVIEDGKISGQGTHEQLLKENIRYNTLYNASKNTERWHI